MSKIYSEKDRLQIIFDLVTEWKCKKNKYIGSTQFGPGVSVSQIKYVSNYMYVNKLLLCNILPTLSVKLTGNFDTLTIR